jgi:hypothetical protein
MLGFRTRFFVNVAGRVVSICVSLAFAVFSTDPIAKYLALLAAIGVLVLVEYLGVYRPSQRFEEVVRKQFDFYFEPFVTGATFSDGTKAGIRVNLMLIKWRFFGRHLVQYYQQGMKGHPDSNLHFPMHAGVCGQAVKNKSDTVTYRHLRGDTQAIAKSEYKWSAKHFGLTTHVRALVTVPLFRERKTFGGSIKHQCFGVLNVDAIDDVGAEFLADPIIQQQIKDYSAFVQLTLA